MLDFTRGNKKLFTISIHDPDRDEALINNLSDVTEARFLIKTNQTDLNTGAIVDKKNDNTLGIMLDARKYQITTSVIPGVRIECSSFIEDYVSGVLDLSYNSTSEQLQLGSGTAIDVSAGGRFKIMDITGNYVIVWVVDADLPIESTSVPITLYYSKGYLTIRIDPDDTKNKEPDEYYVGLQLRWGDFDIQEIDLGTDLIALKLDTVTND